MKHRNCTNDQRGMVAIVTTLILMMVISLIVLGFSQVVRRNQRQALDAQLSSQAFYAAESGLNLARNKLSTDDSFTEHNSCEVIPGIDSYQVSADSSVAITCLLVSPVSDLSFTNVDTVSKVSLIDIGSGSIGDLYISWQNPTDSTVSPGCDGSGNLPPESGGWNCSQPLLRVDLVPLNEMRKDRLDEKQYTAFLYPRSGNSIINSPWANGSGTNLGNIINANCDDNIGGNRKKTCVAHISGMTEGPRYGIRIMSLYGASDVVVHVGGNPRLLGAQVLVDSTARAVDVLKRVQARVPLNGGQNVPDFAIMSSDGICKRYRISDNNVTTQHSNCEL